MFSSLQTGSNGLYDSSISLIGRHCGFLKINSWISFSKYGLTRYMIFNLLLLLIKIGFPWADFFNLFIF